MVNRFCRDCSTCKYLKKSACEVNMQNLSQLNIHDYECDDWYAKADHCIVCGTECTWEDDDNNDKCRFCQ